MYSTVFLQLGHSIITCSFAVSIVLSARAMQGNHHRWLPGQYVYIYITMGSSSWPLVLLPNLEGKTTNLAHKRMEHGAVCLQLHHIRQTVKDHSKSSKGSAPFKGGSPRSKPQNGSWTAHFDCARMYGWLSWRFTTPCSYECPSVPPKNVLVRTDNMYLLTLDIVVASVAMQTDTGTFYSKCDSRLFDWRCSKGCGAYEWLVNDLGVYCSVVLQKWDTWQRASECETQVRKLSDWPTPHPAFLSWSIVFQNFYLPIYSQKRKGPHSNQTPVFAQGV